MLTPVVSGALQERKVTTSGRVVPARVWQRLFPQALDNGIVHTRKAALAEGSYGCAGRATRSRIALSVDDVMGRDVFSSA